MSNFTFSDLENKKEKNFEGEGKMKKMKPSENILQNIFNYSKALSVKKSTHVDYVETILN